MVNYRLCALSEPHALPFRQILYHHARAGAAYSKPGADKAEITVPLSPEEAQDIQESARQQLTVGHEGEGQVVSAEEHLIW